MKQGSVNFITLILAAVIVGGGFYFLVYQPRHQVTQSVDQTIVGGDRDAHGCIGSAGYTWCNIKQKCLRSWEEPCADMTPTPSIDETSAITAAVKAAITKEHGADGNLTYTVKKIEGNYAEGDASEQGGGGMWFAAKTGGTWKLVWDGNGEVLCTDLTQYLDFPKTMIPECYDKTTNTMVNR